MFDGYKTVHKCSICSSGQCIKSYQRLIVVCFASTYSDRKTRLSICGQKYRVCVTEIQQQHKKHPLMSSRLSNTFLLCEHAELQPFVLRLVIVWALWSQDNETLQPFVKHSDPEPFMTYNIQKE